MLRKFLLSLAFLVCLPLAANAATCFWVGGTGNWDNTNTASWASGTGGTPGTCAATGGIPKNATDAATFDASSCVSACTITVCGASSANCPSGAGTLNLTTGIITFGACTNSCTLDFATNAPTVTSRLNGSGTGTRTFNLGATTWIVPGGNTDVWTLNTTTNLTFSSGTSSITINGTPNGGRNFNCGNSQVYNNVSFFGTSNGLIGISLGNSGCTYTSLTIDASTGPISVNFSGTTATITTFVIQNTSASAMAVIFSGINMSLAIGGNVAAQWLSMWDLTFTSHSFTATNAYDLGGNTLNGGSITNPPTGSGGGFIIGGG